MRLSVSLEVVNLIPEEQEWNRALAERHGAELQGKISSATVAICGLGGLGSNIAIALARSGIGKLILIDHDRVDLTNLHRQQYKANQIGMYKTDALCENLREFAPFVVIEAHNACEIDGFHTVGVYDRHELGQEEVKNLADFYIRDFKDPILQSI